MWKLTGDHSPSSETTDRVSNVLFHVPTLDEALVCSGRGGMVGVSLASIQGT
jgi:hypothetical protein